MCICNCDGKRPNDTCCWLSPYGHRCCRITWAWITYVLTLCVLVFDMLLHALSLGSTDPDPSKHTFLGISHAVMLAVMLCLFTLVALVGMFLLVQLEQQINKAITNDEEAQGAADQERDEESVKAHRKREHPSESAFAPAAGVVCEGRPGPQPQHTGYEPVGQTDNP